jgi:hypothetical protein
MGALSFEASKLLSGVMRVIDRDGFGFRVILVRRRGIREAFFTALTPLTVM